MKENKPVIGIVQRQEDNYLSIYFDAINKMGGDPFALPNFNTDFLELISLCDGVIFTGGSTWPVSDEIMLKYCIDNKVPFLGICLGMQMIGNYFSPNHQPGSDDTVKVNTGFNHYFKGDYCHFVNLKDGYLAKVFNANRIRVNSYHNFMVNYTDDEIVKGIADDGVIEALEVPNHPFGIGVQWHPEKMIDYDENSRKLLGEFINASNQKRLRK